MHKTRDRLKEEIGLEKLIMTILVATITSLLNWTWNHKEFLSEEIVYFLYLLTFYLTIAAFISFTKIKFKIKELDYER